MTEHGYTVSAEYWGAIPSGSVEDVTDDVLSKLEQVDVLGPVVSANERGLGVVFSLEYDGPQPLGKVARQGKIVAEKTLAAVGLENMHCAELRVQTYAHQERELETPNFPELVGLSEIADMLDVSKQRVGQLRERPDFPHPVAELRSGPVWSRTMLTRFIEEWPRRSGRPPHLELTKDGLIVRDRLTLDDVARIEKIFRDERPFVLDITQAGALEDEAWTALTSRARILLDEKIPIVIMHSDAQRSQVMAEREDLISHAEGAMVRYLPRTA